MKNDITVKDYITHGIYFLIYGIVKYMPSPIGDILRYFISKPFFRKIGSVRIYEGSTFWYPYRIKIGTNVTINEWCYLSGFGGLTIGDNVSIGHRTTIVTSEHRHADLDKSIKSQGLDALQVNIESDVWIGANVTILAGVNVGQGSILAAGSVVTKNVESFSIVAGVPAKQIRMRKGG